MKNAAGCAADDGGAVSVREGLRLPSGILTLEEMVVALCP